MTFQWDMWPWDIVSAVPMPLLSHMLPTERVLLCIEYYKSYRVCGGKKTHVLRLFTKTQTYLRIDCQSLYGVVLVRLTNTRARTK